MKIFGTLSAIIIGLTFTACTTAQEGTIDGENKFIDVFGIARVAPGTDKIPMPETEKDWLTITNKIDNGKIDESVVLATYSDEWPEKYDKNDIRNRYTSKVFQTLEYNKATGTFVGIANAGDLPSSDELNEIWQKMLEEIERQRAEKKTAKD